MSNLFLSFTIAIGCAIGLVASSRVFDFESYTNKILPLIPVLYAVIYEMSIRRKGSRSSQNRRPPRAATKKVSTSRKSA